MVSWYYGGSQVRNGGHGAFDEFKLSHRHPPCILPFVFQLGKLRVKGKLSWARSSLAPVWTESEMQVNGTWLGWGENLHPVIYPTGGPVFLHFSWKYRFHSFLEPTEIFFVFSACQRKFFADSWSFFNALESIFDNMKLSFVLQVFAAVAFTTATDVTPPACAVSAFVLTSCIVCNHLQLPCINAAVPSSGCTATDYVCQCTTGRTAIFNSIVPCLTKSKCSNADYARKCCFFLGLNQLTGYS